MHRATNRLVSMITIVRITMRLLVLTNRRCMSIMEITTKTTVRSVIILLMQLFHLCLPV